MKEQSPLILKKKISALNKPLTFEFKKFFISLSKSAVDAYNAEWDKATKDFLDSLSAVGLKDSYEERAWLLITRSLTSAIYKISQEHREVFEEYTPKDHKLEEFCNKLSSNLDNYEVVINEDFFTNPTSLDFLRNISQSFKEWLLELNIPEHMSDSIISRLPVYFVYSLHEEWSKHHEEYKCLQEQIDTPFTKATTNLSEWERYKASLQLEVEYGMFHETFSLKSMFIWLRAYSEINKDDDEHLGNKNQENSRRPFWLKEELNSWLKKRDAKDAIRIISGGPGSGKSSFAKMFAAELSKGNSVNAIIVPLHRLKVKDDFETAIETFFEKHTAMSFNPLQITLNSSPILLLLDGLDELAMQGKTGADTAIKFIRHVKEKINDINNGEASAKILAIIGGREIVVQSVKDDFRGDGKIIHLMPYYIDKNEHNKFKIKKDSELLQLDQREEWWKKYHRFNGQKEMGVPEALHESKLRDVTSQPLLNYLVALSYQRKKIDFSKEQNLNSIYADLLDGVYERGYEQNRSVVEISKKQFEQTLEEISLAVWHSDGRKASIGDIEKQCDQKVLHSFADGAQKGIVKLLTAFYFRHSGDAYDQTFEFTHKSFGEYLIAKRLVRAMKVMVDEIKRHEDESDRGLDEDGALNYWYKFTNASIIDEYIFDFIVNEIELYSIEEVMVWQKYVVKLFSYMLQNDLPLEAMTTQGYSYKKMQVSARNCKESLLIVMNACARRTKELSEITSKDSTIFGNFMLEINKQLTGGRRLSRECYSYLKLDNMILHNQDFYLSNLSFSSFKNATMMFSLMLHATLKEAHFEEAHLGGAHLEGAHLEGANLKEANLKEANLKEANLERTNLERTNLERTNLEGANLEGANLEGANLQGANLEQTNFQGANLEGANLQGANLQGANLQGANLEGANLEGANLEGANLKRAKFKGVELKNIAQFKSLI